MQKLRTLLALLVASICSVQGAWADRVAPTLPTAQTLQSGESYYLLNVMEGKFACRSTTNTSYAGLGTYGDKVTITATENADEYTIQWASNNYYWGGYDSYVSSDYYESSYSYFTIAESSNGYTIQRSPMNTQYYQEDQFIGFDGSNGDRLSPLLAEGSIHWKLISVDDAEYYFAKHKLYTYLEVADQYNFYVTQYELVYNNQASTTAELDFAQLTLENALSLSQNYVSPSWTEYPILFQNTTDNKWELSGENLYWSFYMNGNAEEKTSTLKATVNVDNDATLVYTYQSDSYTSMRVFLDGELVQNVTPNQSSNSTRRYYVELSPGKHDVSWTCVFNKGEVDYYTHTQTLSEIGVQNTPTITPATTTVEGQLGTEVLRLVDPVSSVKKIVVNGVIGADDWTTLGLMVNAFSIDLSGATATAPLPARLFTKNKFPFLHSIKLPQGLTEIGEYAFDGSDIEGDITFPTSMKTIGQNAFYRTKIKGAYMSDGIMSIGREAFSDCYYLENITYPATAGIIPNYCFYRCYNLRTFTIPEGITEVGQYAFYQCNQFNARFPSTMKFINYYAFYDTATDELIVTEDMIVQNWAFEHCNSLTYAEWATSFVETTGGSYYWGTNYIVTYCPKLSTVVLKSPTVVVLQEKGFFDGNDMSKITLKVPDFLVNAYKLDPYWYQCNVEGFNSADIADWNVKKPLVLNAGQRMSGSPSLHFSEEGNLTVNGDDAQNINNLSINYCPISFYSSSTYNQNQQWGFMLSNSDYVNITGELSENVFTNEKEWYFFALPFDTKVADITATALETGAATSFAIRYYDGATRASEGMGSSWKNYAKTDIIPAGTGFIYQTAKAAKSKFVAQNNTSKQYILSNNEFVKALEAHPSDVTANKGWNLVGNPWQTYYNIHKLNFTAPITVWDYDANYGYGNYVAYSIIDDDYAIKPLEAIFVQCPDEVNNISFPIDGRQLTTKIESQNGARADQPSERKLIDVVLSTGDMSDKTRFVLNPQAQLSYELTRDASKFMSMDAAVPQLYTIEQGTRMAINERPMGNATVQLGIKVAQNGEYTLSAPRCQFTSIILVDKETSLETDLATGISYTFQAQAGTSDDRFMLRLGGSDITSVNSIDAMSQQADKMYNLQGQRVNQLQQGLYIKNGKKVIIK